MAWQQRLSFPGPGAYRRDQFVVGACNREALTLLDAWPAWPGGAVALIGPEGSGKTHLARIWAERAAATALDAAAPDLSAPGAGAVLVEDVDRGLNEEGLFHLFNQAARPGRGLLVTARRPPGAWTLALPDLRSRAGALTVAELDEPDDATLEAVLRQLFDQRQVTPSDDLILYLIRRMERSIRAAADLVDRIVLRADMEGRPIGRGLARTLLDEDQATPDLFE